ncbi:DUF1190 domain-containing protein [Rhodobacter sp. KR11]|jgi:uncharacterized protein YgiB involved in biofilm formation|uniref:DUF1190 domain-containing protein n=1 Tax=Rhodobacter sp. KR11 TaxID=2974588 RepID=UPI0022219D16|nr:DUF1190 domain-containing protein [Rhodobacter sp. KR11]MCW1920725.1 DUF1190 domain-containing protein [Rhodobacter sp. KR11]
MRKRSDRVALCILGAAAFALAGCGEDEVDASAFPDLATCKASAALGGQDFTAADCDRAYAEAQAIHQDSAPRYDAKVVCEEQHGEEACVEAADGNGGGGSIFMPLMAGYLIGNMLNRGTVAQPLYRSAAGGFSDAAGRATYATNLGQGKLGASQFDRPAATVGKPPMSAATVKARGGFGASAGGRTSAG